mmetsp:Transcript_55301/g.103725  ORF Transcript_55301/g.103725 Transcript_55301/m.103725 type:complete len:221 (-) Transcript_55301:35-697(-)
MAASAGRSIEPMDDEDLVEDVRFPVTEGIKARGPRAGGERRTFRDEAKGTKSKLKAGGAGYKAIPGTRVIRKKAKSEAKATPTIAAPTTGDNVRPMRKRKNKGQTAYSGFIFKVLKQVHPGLGISKRGMGIMNSFMNDVFDRIATESTRLLRSMSRRTLSGREVQTSVRLLLPGELAKHAVSEGTKAVNKFFNQEGDEETQKLPAGTPRALRRPTRRNAA